MAPPIDCYAVLHVLRFAAGKLRGKEDNRVPLLDKPPEDFLKMHFGAPCLGVLHVSPVENKDVHMTKNTFGWP
jgi:hypothetical protein